MTVVPAPVPLDWRSTNDDFGLAVTAAIDSPDVDAILVVHAPPIAAAHAAVRRHRCRGSRFDHAGAGGDARAGTTAPSARARRCPSFSFPEPAAAVLGRMYGYRRWLDTEAAVVVTAELDGVDRDGVSVVLSAAVQRGDVTASSADAMAVLAAYGINAPPTTLITDATADEIVVGARIRSATRSH